MARLVRHCFYWILIEPASPFLRDLQNSCAFNGPSRPASPKSDYFLYHYHLQKFFRFPIKFTAPAAPG